MLEHRILAIRSGRTWPDRNLRNRWPITIVSACRGPGRLPSKETTGSVWGTSVRACLAAWIANLEQHHAIALDAQGRRLGDREFGATQAGYEHLLRWLRDFGIVCAVGVERGLARFLTAGGATVIEVNQPHHHLRYRLGKTDAIDAEAAARNVLACEATTVPKNTTSIVESIRQLPLVRGSAITATLSVAQAAANMQHHSSSTTMTTGLKSRTSRVRVADLAARQPEHRAAPPSGEARHPMMAVQAGGGVARP